MLDFEEWNKYLEIHPKQKNILVYHLHGNSDTYKMANKYAKSQYLEMIKINTMYHQYKIGAKKYYASKL